MLPRINESHTIQQAISIKENNKSVSEKTLSKIQTKLFKVDKSSVSRELIKQMDGISDSLHSMKHHDAYQDVSGLVAKHFAVHALNYNKSHPLPDQASRSYDTVSLSWECKNASQESNGCILNL